MLKVSAISCIPKLKTILRSNKLYFIICIFLSLEVLIFTKIINYQSIYENPNVLEGKVIEVEEKTNYYTLTIKTPEKVICNIQKGTIDITNILGSKVRVEGTKKELLNNTIPNNFNYKKYLYNKHIYLSFEVSNLKVLKDGSIFYKIKRGFINRINKISDKDLQIKNYLNLFILGNNDYLDTDLYDIYKTNGIWHLFALSGLHYSIIILFFEKILSRFKFKNFIITAFLLFYLFMVGYKISLLRVVIYYILKNILNYLEIDLSSLKIFWLDMFIVILVNPFIVCDIGFLYSYIITFFLLLKQRKIKGSYFKVLLIISLISFLASLPITINLNYEINLLSIFVNLLVAPFITFGVFIVSILSFIIPVFLPILKIMVTILEDLNIILNNYKIMMIIPKIPYILIIVYYLILYFMFKYNSIKYFISLISIVLINILLPKLDSNYYVYFLDVGQGDSAILLSPHKEEVIMVDTGGTFTDYHPAKNTITFLKSLGIKKINLLITSHGDNDHAKDTLYILDNYKIDNIILNKNKENALEKEIRAKGHVVSTYSSSYFSYLNIFDYNTSNDENKSSIISYFKIRKYNFLFMGDVPKEIENKFLNDYNLPVNFLKIAHHGSKTSSSVNFLEKVNPNLAIISSGRNNIYNHPSSEVIENLEKLNIKYLNTQTSGTISVKVSQNDYKIKTYEP